MFLTRLLHSQRHGLCLHKYGKSHLSPAPATAFQDLEPLREGKNRREQQSAPQLSRKDCPNLLMDRQGELHNMGLRLLLGYPLEPL